MEFPACADEIVPVRTSRRNPTGHGPVETIIVKGTSTQL
jgi:hypothetical protein